MHQSCIPVPSANEWTEKPAHHIVEFFWYYILQKEPGFKNH